MSNKKNKSEGKLFSFHPVLKALGITKKKKSYFPSMQPMKKYPKTN